LQAEEPANDEMLTDILNEYIVNYQIKELLQNGGDKNGSKNY